MDFEIVERQKSDVLFATDEPLDGSGSYVSDVRLIQGYGQIRILAISDQPFSIVVEEAPTLEAAKAGRFIQTSSSSSSISNGQQQVSVPVTPVGSYMRVAISNLGAAMTALQMEGFGIPIP